MNPNADCYRVGAVAKLRVIAGLIQDFHRAIGSIVGVVGLEYVLGVEICCLDLRGEVEGLGLKVWSSGVDCS